MDRIKTITSKIAEAEHEVDGIRDQEELLDMEVTSQKWLARIGGMKKTLEPFTTMWMSIQTHQESMSTWMETPLVELNAEEADREADNVRRAMIKVSKGFARDSIEAPIKAAEITRDEADKVLKDYVPLMVLLCNPGLRERHWATISELTGLSVSFNGGQNTLSDMVAVGMTEFCETIEDVCVNASKEFSLEKAMDVMEEEWKPMAFTCKSYRKTGTHILSGIDEIQTLLDDHIVKTQAMRSSRYIKPFMARILDWEKTLVNLQDIMDNWLKLQGIWLYLEPIFGSEDIVKQMPTEAKLFKSVDETWRTAMEETVEVPSVIATARREGLLESLQKANEDMEVIQKGLNDYLETKRLFFPRFFFLSNDELLEILSETKDPLRVQPHLKKCFEGINQLEFDDDLNILSMISPKKKKCRLITR